MSRHPSTVGWALLSLALLTGCNRDDVQVYRVSKEQAPEPAGNGALPPNHPQLSGAPASPPQLKWTLPTGWEEAPAGQMRVASFKVQENGKQGEVGVVPLPGFVGHDLETVNRWRASVGLPAVTEEDLPKLAEKIEVAGQEADLYDQAGENPGSGDKTRILAAILRREGVAWFFKFTGDDELVSKQKPAFLQLLKSLTFVSGGAAPMTASGGTLPPSHPPIEGAGAMMQTANIGKSGEGRPTWEVPSGWNEAPAGQFLVAKFNISGADNENAAVNVSMSPGEGGGLLGNINRWRGQLGLAELPETEVNKLTSTLETAGGKATVVDISGTDARTGQKARLVGAILPRDGNTWFYKLMGSERVVENQKDAFSNFVRTAKYN